MKTPKEKAESLVEKFKEIRVFEDVNGGFPLDDAEAIKCAKITVDEIIKYGGTIFVVEYPKNTFKNGMDYWQEVKTELNKL